MKRVFYFALGVFSVIVLAATYGGGGNGPYFNGIVGIIAGSGMTGSTNLGTVTLTSTGGSGLPGTAQIIAYGSTAHTNWSAEDNGGWYETNTTGGLVIASNGTVVISGPSGVNGQQTWNDSGGAVEGTFTNGALWLKNGLIATAYLRGTNADLWAIRSQSYTTNLPVTGNGTVTWDVSKPTSFLETNADVTVNLSGIPATLTNEIFACLSISNSDTVKHLITLGGFCAFTNGAGVATSTFYMTNLDAKHQNVEIDVHIKADRTWQYTNAIVTHFFDK